MDRSYYHEQRPAVPVVKWIAMRTSLSHIDSIYYILSIWTQSGASLARTQTHALFASWAYMYTEYIVYAEHDRSSRRRRRVVPLLLKSSLSCSVGCWFDYVSRRWLFFLSLFYRESFPPLYTRIFSPSAPSTSINRKDPPTSLYRKQSCSLLFIPLCYVCIFDMQLLSYLRQ